MRISDWSSDVCSSDLIDLVDDLLGKDALDDRPALLADQVEENRLPFRLKLFGPLAGSADDVGVERAGEASLRRGDDQQRSKEHTSELQSHIRTSSAVLCLKQNKSDTQYVNHTTYISIS